MPLKIPARRAEYYIGLVVNSGMGKVHFPLNQDNLTAGEHEMIADVRGLKYPVKIVVDVDDGIITVITNYPLKKGRENESTL